MSSGGTGTDSADDLRNCPACRKWDAPVERLGQRTREDGVMVIGWRCLSCGTDMSELVGEGKVSDMVEESPKVGEPVTDGGFRTDDTESCPKCGSVVTEKGVSIDGNTIASEVYWLYCIGCGWDNRSQNPDGDG